MINTVRARKMKKGDQVQVDKKKKKCFQEQIKQICLGKKQKHQTEFLVPG